MFLRIRHLVFYINLFILFLPGIVSAQIQTTFNFGNILSSADGHSSFTGPIIISGNGKCLNVQNGIGLYESSSIFNGLFRLNCTDDKVNFSISCYPNPFVSSTVVFLNAGLDIDEDFRLAVLNISGQEIGTFYGKIGQLSSGFRINLDKHAVGTYFLRIFSQRFTGSLKIIKIGN